MKIIAEAGVNHNGSKDLAFKMVKAAAESGADYIKFQTFRAEELVTVDCEAAGYQKKNMGAVRQLEMLRSLQLSNEDFRELKNYCDKLGIGFLSTPFDDASIDFIASLKPDFMKVPSGEITNVPYLRKIAATHIPVIVSTGMSDLADIREALKVFQEAGYDKKDIILLHCTTQYPTPMEDVNLKAMDTLRREVGCEAGYSDHTEGIEVSVAASAMGASVIEKHFTLDRSMDGPDHKASLEPIELRKLVESVRNVEIALGDGKKVVKDSEKANMTAARRSIVAARIIKRGEVINEEAIRCKRPAIGLSPVYWDNVIGSVAERDFEVDEPIIISFNKTDKSK